MSSKLLALKITKHVREVAYRFIERFPATEKTFSDEQKITLAMFIKAWYGIIYALLNSDRFRNKYLFVSLRNKEIISSLFGTEDICVLTTSDEKQLCLNYGWNYYWVGGIHASIMLALKMNIYTPLKLNIFLLKCRLKNKNSWIINYNDTSPIGVFFSMLGNECLCPTLCVGHGFGVVLKDLDIIYDGAHTKYLMLYSLDDKAIAPSPITKCYELGPPFDVDPLENKSNQLILVGVGSTAILPDFYRRSLIFYKKIYEIAIQLGINIQYRPHLSERDGDFSDFFTDIDNSEKINCLSLTKKLFIGFNSTLLFEAKYFGHEVIILSDPDINISNLHVDAIYSYDQLDLVIGDIKKYQLARFDFDELKLKKLPLKNRFKTIYDEICILESRRI